MREALRLSGLVFIVVLLAACGTGSGPQVNQIVVTLKDSTILVGEATTASAKVEASGGASQEIFWTVINDDIANVTPSGAVTGIASGTTQVVATSAFDSTKTARATLTVTPQPAVTSVVVDVFNSLYVGGTSQAKVNVAAVGGADESVTWSVSDNTLAEVDSAGLVTGVATGTVELTATSNFDPTISDAVTLQILPAPAVESINVTLNDSSLVPGESTTANATVSVTSGADNSVTWSVSDETVAEIDESGVVATLAPGTTNIIATSVFDSSVSGIATLTVLPPTPELQLWRCDSLSGCNSPWSEPEQVSWPYSYTSQSIISTTGSAVTLGSYFLRAITDEFTITGASAQETSGRIAPTFLGLSNGTVIRPGNDVHFTLVSPRTGGLQLTLNFTFEVTENGDTFSHTALLRTN